MSSNAVGRLAGSDTREASTTQTVRLSALAAALFAGPAWAAAFGSLSALERWFVLPRWLDDWWFVALISSAIAAAILAWRQGGSGLPGVGPIAITATTAGAVLITGSDRIAALTLPFLPALAGWFVGRTARAAAPACVPQVTPAVCGLMTTGAIAGLALAGPLAAVTDGSGFRWGAFWTFLCVGIAALNVMRARATLEEDRQRSEARAKAVQLSTGNGQAAAFECEGVSVAFGNNEVLRGTSLHASAGEFVALVGGNGAGKSTLLRTAAGFVECRGGRVSVGGHDVSMLRAEERAQLGLAFVSGARPVFPDLTVMENLRVSAFHSHLSMRSFSSATDSIFEIAPALHARRRERAGVLSGGEQRLLAVAQTLYRRPVALLADELTLGVATEARIAILDLLRYLADNGVAVVAVDHDLASLLPRSDRAVLLSDGVAKSFTDPSSLLGKRSKLLPATFLAEVPR